ncbi:hypothetical protein SDRG_15720 [Saprolegnia diclina VS20]|uniref:Uncharacterized protein n=1 Tax=Saprolegnia diclina (strain VS20) TaxID=1156394 RepID=T0PM35_SAPDV|nr:hypothetical protein SDRG_15720 [Saprolegnia diclina VS20]EQC26439.1 hypothetical protein SDRG_15720 [Saprolegnia diclina VS20]|eukprot:XP_008620124.1 hypothetical protein SDRG_15720 [Saprolegnia diclina VS20]
MLEHHASVPTRKMAASCATTAALNCNGTLIAIVQCIASSCDVVAFLDALPPQVLGEPLLALHALLSRPGQFLHAWPRPCFLGLVDDEEALAQAALPAYEAFDEFLAASISTDPGTFSAFLSLWAHKMTAIDLTCSANLINEALCQALRRCTRLCEVSLDSSPMTPHVFQAVTTAAHHVSRLTVQTARGHAFDWAPLVTSWLASGHAQHLGLCHVPVPTDALARAVSRTSTLRSLEIRMSDDFVVQLLRIGESLHHLTHFSVETKAPIHLVRILHLVSLRSLSSIALSCNMPLNPVFHQLCRSSVLEELDLRWCSLTVGSPDVGHWPRLRLAQFDAVNFSPEVFDNVVANLTSSNVLERVHFLECSVLSTKMNVLGSALVHWINRGLRALRLADDRFDDTCAAVLATALRQASNTAPFTLSLNENDLTLEGVTDLLSALASCVCVRIELNATENLGGHTDELVAVATRFGIKAICGQDVFEFYSPLAIKV